MYVCVFVHTQVCVWKYFVCECVRSSLPWHAYLNALSWSSRSTDSSKKKKADLGELSGDS